MLKVCGVSMIRRTLHMIRFVHQHPEALKDKATEEDHEVQSSNSDLLGATDGQNPAPVDMQTSNVREI